jgi:hypothetical protein
MFTVCCALAKADKVCYQTAIFAAAQRPAASGERPATMNVKISINLIEGTQHE